MDVLGHSQIAITMDLYAHVMPTALREAADAIDRALGQANDGRSLKTDALGVRIPPVLEDDDRPDPATEAYSVTVARSYRPLLSADIHRPVSTVLAT
jgi:hypothetical protein